MRTELAVAHHTAQQTHIGSTDTIVLVKRHWRQRTDVNFDFMFRRYGRRQLFVKTVNTFDNQHGIFLQLQLVAAIFTAAGAEIVLGHFHFFTCQQTLQMIVEQLQVDSLQAFKIIAAVSLTRRIDTVFIIIVHGNSYRTQAVDSHLNAQTLCRRGLAGRGRTCNQHQLQLMVTCQDIGNIGQLLFMQRFRYLNNLFGIA